MGNAVRYRSVVSGFTMNVALDVNTLSEYRTFVAAVSQEKQWKLEQAIVPICCYVRVSSLSKCKHSVRVFSNKRRHSLRRLGDGTIHSDNVREQTCRTITLLKIDS